MRGTIGSMKDQWNTFSPDEKLRWKFLFIIYVVVSIILSDYIGHDSIVNVIPTVSSITYPMISLMSLVYMGHVTLIKEED